jgi:3-deoxy-D-manno-octulosonate 8-phosphate phosphatase KdsC-like HAD superfamily phosphatase
MAKFILKFLDRADNIVIQVTELDGIISIFSIDYEQEGNPCVAIHLDKSTAIKFAKTLRTEINKITDEEVGNG